MATNILRDSAINPHPVRQSDTSISATTVKRRLIFIATLTAGIFIGSSTVFYLTSSEVRTKEMEIKRLERSVSELQSFRNLVERLLPEGWGGAT